MVEERNCERTAKRNVREDILRCSLADRQFAGSKAVEKPVLELICEDACALCKPEQNLSRLSRWWLFDRGKLGFHFDSYIPRN